MLIDQFGRPRKNMGMEEIELLNRVSYKTDVNGNVTYICYDADTKTEIRRITTEGTVTTIEFSFGKWADRATLTYVPINAAYEVTE